MELLAGDRQPMGDAVGLVLGFNGGVRPAVEGEGEDFPGVGLSRTGFVGSVCGSLPPGRRPLRVRGRERGRRQVMNTVWTSSLTNEMVSELKAGDIISLQIELNDAVMEICQRYGIEGN